MRHTTYSNERTTVMGDTVVTPKLTLFLDYGPIEIDGPIATGLYKEIVDKKNIIERNPSQTRYTSEIELSDGSVTCFNVNKLSGYQYQKGGSPDERFNKQLNRLNALVKENKNKL